MKTAAELAGAVGVVAVAPTFEVLVGALPTAEEFALDKQFQRIAAKDSNPYARAEPTLQYLAKRAAAGDRQAGVDRAALLERVAELAGTGEAPSFAAVSDARESAEGVAFELWFRGRAHDPNLTLEKCRAVVNDANALAVHLGILTALSARANDPKATRSPGQGGSPGETSGSLSGT